MQQQATANSKGGSMKRPKVESDGARKKKIDAWVSEEELAEITKLSEAHGFRGNRAEFVRNALLGLIVVDRTKLDNDKK